MNNVFGGEDLKLETADGRKILRPCGLSDTPGGAAPTGVTAAMLGLCFALRPIGAFRRVACAGLAVLRGRGHLLHAGPVVAGHARPELHRHHRPVPLPGQCAERDDADGRRGGHGGRGAALGGPDDGQQDLRTVWDACGVRHRQHGDAEPGRVRAGGADAVRLGVPPRLRPRLVGDDARDVQEPEQDLDGLGRDHDLWVDLRRGRPAHDRVRRRGRGRAARLAADRPQEPRPPTSSSGPPPWWRRT